MKDAVDPTDLELPRSVAKLIRENRGHLSLARRTNLEQQWLARIPERRRWQARTAWVAAGVASIVAIGAVVVAMSRRTPSPLGVVISGAHIVGAGAIEADKGEGPRLHFSDGSDVRLSAATFASLRHVDECGATISVRDGSADVDIPHHPQARWVFEAGPFVIRVTGTAFRFAWNSGAEEFDLQMRRGTVAVAGPLTNGTLALRAGEHLIVHVRRGEAVLREREVQDSPSAAASGVVAAEPAVGAVAAAGASSDSSRDVGPRESVVRESGGARARNAPRGDASESWTALVERGAFDVVVADARRRGLDATLARAPAPELAALADAARYTRDDDVARRALLAECHRFPGTTVGHEAAFLLGRLEEARNDPSAAIEWYRRYGVEDPKGRYVAEALGRRMVLLTSSSAEEARRVAEDYLRRFPSGAYAARARAAAKAP